MFGWWREVQLVSIFARCLERQELDFGQASSEETFDSSVEFVSLSVLVQWIVGIVAVPWLLHAELICRDLNRDWSLMLCINFEIKLIFNICYSNNSLCNLIDMILHNLQ